MHGEGQEASGHSAPTPWPQGPGHGPSSCPSRTPDSARPVNVPLGYCTSVAATGLPQGHSPGVPCSSPRKGRANLWEGTGAGCPTGRMDRQGWGWRTGARTVPDLATPTSDGGGGGQRGDQAPPTSLTSPAPCQLPPSDQRSHGPPCLCLRGASHPGEGVSWEQAPRAAAPWACGPASSHRPGSSPPSGAPRSPGSGVWEAGLPKSGTSSGERRTAMEMQRWPARGRTHASGPAQEVGGQSQETMPALAMVAAHAGDHPVLP